MLPPEISRSRGGGFINKTTFTASQVIAIVLEFILVWTSVSINDNICVELIA